MALLSGLGGCRLACRTGIIFCIFQMSEANEEHQMRMSGTPHSLHACLCLPKKCEKIQLF